MPKLRFPEFTGEWEEKRLNELLVRYSKNNKDEEFVIDDILSLSSQYGIVDRKELLEDTYSKVNHLNYIKTRKNDLVYGKSISSKYPYGLFKVNNLRDGLLSTLYFTFKANNKEVSIFLDKYFSLSNRVNNFLRKFVLVGDRYITADSDYILSGKIFFPSLPEQEKIASFLSKVDEKIEKLERKKELWEEYKKGVMQRIFSREIRFKDDEGQEFCEWEGRKLGEVSECLDNLRKPLNTEEREKIKGNIPYWGANNIMDYINDYIFDETIVLLVEDGGNFNEYKTRPIANISYGKCWVNNHTHVLKEKKGISKNEFLYYSLVHKNITGYVSGGTRSKLTKSEMLKIKIKLPFLPEQEKISNFLSNLDTKIDVLEREIERNKEFKRGLLQQLFC